MEPRKLLRMKQVRERLPLSVGNLYGLISSRKLESVRIGKTILVPETALEDFIAANTNSALQD